MSKPDYAAYAVRRVDETVPPSAPRPRRKVDRAVLACTALLILCSMCLRSAWDGSGLHELSAQERQEALQMPPSMVSEEKRRALVFRVNAEIRERIETLQTIAGEDSPAAEDARRALKNTLDCLTR